ncbi:MAG: hypothetical protein ACOH2H_25910, partial [Cypionkella sp.]
RSPHPNPDPRRPLTLSLVAIKPPAASDRTALVDVQLHSSNSLHAKDAMTEVSSAEAAIRSGNG